MLSISYKKSKCKFFSFVHFIQCCSMEVWKVDGKVSISEPRCFSFQVTRFSHVAIASFTFQSRNRDAFRFKPVYRSWCFHYYQSFNLGIEMLFVSSSQIHLHRLWHNCRRFNLGIEMLFISRTPGRMPTGHSLTANSFNLGIEMLFVSRRRCRHQYPCDRLVSISESRCFSFQDPTGRFTSATFT